MGSQTLGEGSPAETNGGIGLSDCTNWSDTDLVAGNHAGVGHLNDAWVTPEVAAVHVALVTVW